MAVHEGERKPLFNEAMEGAFSPSASLLIERHRIEPISWPRVMIPKQVVTLALDTHEIQYQSGSKSPRTEVRPKGTAIVERRECEQHICWKSAATLLTVELNDAVLEDVQTTNMEFGAGEDRVAGLSSLLYALETERYQGYPHGQLYLDGIEQAVACLVVARTGHTRLRRAREVPLMAPHQMRRVHEFVKAHLDKKISLREMAREAGLSTSHFSRLFRKSTGKTPHQYVLERRIDHSKGMMADSRYSLLDIAIASGFRTHQHFSKVFHRLTGSSPRQYRLRV